MPDTFDLVHNGPTQWCRHQLGQVILLLPPIDLKAEMCPNCGGNLPKQLGNFGIRSATAKTVRNRRSTAMLAARRFDRYLRHFTRRRRWRS